MGACRDALKNLSWEVQSRSLFKSLRSKRGQWLSTLNSLALSLSLIFPVVPMLENTQAPVT